MTEDISDIELLSMKLHAIVLAIANVVSLSFVLTFPVLIAAVLALTVLTVIQVNKTIAFRDSEENKKFDKWLVQYNYISNGTD